MDRMTPHDVKLRVDAIQATVTDDERAHGLADDLYRDVLAAIAGGAANAQEMAAAALRTEVLGFARWYA